MSIDLEQLRHERSGSGGRLVYPFADGTEAELNYLTRAGVATITHTGTPPQHRGQGHAALLVERAVADFRAAGLKVVPACSYARQQFDRHPEWADLLHHEGG